MHDSIVNQTAVVGDTSTSPEPPARARGAEKASGFYVVRTLDNEQSPPPSSGNVLDGRRGYGWRWAVWRKRAV